MHCSFDCDPTKSYFIFLISKKWLFKKTFFRNFHFTKGRHSGGRVSRSFSDCLGPLRFHVHDWSSLLRRTWNFNSKIRLQNFRKHTTVENDHLIEFHLTFSVDRKFLIIWAFDRILFWRLIKSFNKKY